MNDASFNTSPFAEPSAWQSFARRAVVPAASATPLRRLSESRRATCGNWWALGVALGLFASSTLVHPVHAQAVDYLKAGTALFRKRHGGALTFTTAATHVAPANEHRDVLLSSDRRTRTSIGDTELRGRPVQGKECDTAASTFSHSGEPS